MQATPSISKVPTTESSWEDIINRYNQHSNQLHPCFKLHPACEQCHPVLIITDSTWDTFLDWYKHYFSAVGYSGETLNRYRIFKNTVQTLISQPFTDQRKDEAFNATAKLIGAFQYSFSPNYSIADTLEILINLAARTDNFVKSDIVLSEYTKIRQALREQGKSLFQKPRSPSPPVDTDIPLTTRRGSTDSTSSKFSLAQLIPKPFGKRAESSTTTFQKKTTTLRSGFQFPKHTYAGILTNPSKTSQELQETSQAVHELIQQTSGPSNPRRPPSFFRTSTPEFDSERNERILFEQSPIPF